MSANGFSSFVSPNVVNSDLGKMLIGIFGFKILSIELVKFVLPEAL